MPEMLPEITKGIKQFIDIAKAPKELSALIEKFGAPGEKVLHTIYGRYWNTRKLLDKPIGVVLITNQRFIFVSKMPMIPLIKGTNEIVFPLGSIELAENVKFRRIRAAQLTVNKMSYLFMINHFYKPWKPTFVDEVIQVIIQAKAGLT